jgi:hypothetical protein
VNTRLSVSTLAYLAEQEKRGEEERLREEQARIEHENVQRQQAELFVKKGTLPYSEVLAQEICERISCGELLIIICLDAHLPTQRRVNQWLREHEDFAMFYKESLKDRLDVFEEAVILIADDASRDFKDVVRNGRATRVPDGEAIARAKLRVEVRFRHLKAGRPEKWGDSQTIITKSDGEDFASVTTEELERKISEFERKSGVVRRAA